MAPEVARFAAAFDSQASRLSLRDPDAPEQLGADDNAAAISCPPRGKTRGKQRKPPAADNTKIDGRLATVRDLLRNWPPAELREQLLLTLPEEEVDKLVPPASCSAAMTPGAGLLVVTAAQRKHAVSVGLGTFCARAVFCLIEPVQQRNSFLQCFTT